MDDKRKTVISYILIVAGLSFFALGALSTLINSFKVQKEYELLSTELVRTDTALRDLEIKYSDSQNELKIFKLKIEASHAWTKDEMTEAHGELEKLKAEYVRVKVTADKERVFDAQKVQEQCRKVLAEAEEYNKLLSERNKELGELKNVFDSMKVQLENNQKILSQTHEHLKSLQSITDTHQKMRDVISSLEDLRKNIRDSAPKESGKNHLDTMKSFLSSLDKESGEEKLVY